MYSLLGRTIGGIVGVAALVTLASAIAWVASHFDLLTR